ncbi:LLM class flavin-dependent oxidoreductase [Lentzea nigeriaca]|uniref:LLM class flavin-dependent oxidoreductase n=1 Tax=Lentzea nigeriaca TaxID=1128665 RepID=UPI00195A0460|nr:LLM class flavin-dependent oxidoreductase [Lentzea nigeriaca]MBM7859020.1 alkanesulfonate monooxygenase SsuD/methylene tetrahydromethanopterin reductase-like flavin-dependent oxidoreductase (luciferase family) [Lentzea nigeriaca]
MGSPLHLAVALQATGDETFSAEHWVEQVREAEEATLDFVTFDDSLAGEPGLDAVLTAARVAPLTTHIGLVPTAVVTHTEPFHLSKAIATLDYVSKGRAGVQLTTDSLAAKHFGRRDDFTDLWEEAADYAEVLRRLWDSWEDDAEIRDVATGRFIDREKLHYIDFEGRWFNVRGPSITPRPPQGHPPIAATEPGFADVVFADDPSVSDKLVFRDVDGTADPQQLITWQDQGFAGFRFHVADLREITRGLVPELRREGLFRTAYEHPTLRGRLGLAKPADQYA